MSNANVSCASTGNEAAASEQQPEKEIRLRVLVFFDGTMNNMFNAAAGTTSKGGSYANAASNVALLYRAIDKPALEAGGWKVKTLYVEGIGTRAGKSDSTLTGGAFGDDPIWGTGIVQRVDQAISTVKDYVKSAVPEGERKHTRITALDFFVYGFSRGAAAARLFCHRIFDAYFFRSNKQLLNFQSLVSLIRGGINISADAVKVKFCGLFDTVASYGWDGTVKEQSATEALHLDAVSKAERVVHLTAMDEHRVNFALTDIGSAAGKGIEIPLPGVHSDIGGGYLDNYTLEGKLCVINNDNIFKRDRTLARELQQLIDAGWFERSDVFHKSGRMMQDSDSDLEDALDFHDQVFVRRLGSDRSSGISNRYYTIALQLMGEHSQQHEVVFSADFREKRSYVLLAGARGDSPDLIRARELIGQYAQKVAAGTPVHVAVAGLSTQGFELLKRIRRDYLHFSAYYDGVAINVNKPRYEGGVRKRLVHAG